KVVNEPHKAKLSHELIAAAASYEAMKAWNDHLEKNGKPASHAKAKEILAAASGAFIDGIFESKGLDAIDGLRAKSKDHGKGLSIHRQLSILTIIHSFQAPRQAPQ
ncbi:hypothetical protein BS17DRAFT_707562, partial [Gyrodon lividus]